MAQYVRMPSAPARLQQIMLSIVMRFSSMQPAAAAHFNIAYSPETW